MRGKLVVNNTLSFKQHHWNESPAQSSLQQTDVSQVHRVLSQHIQMYIDSVLSLFGVWVTLRGRVSHYLAVCLQVLAA